MSADGSIVYYHTPKPPHLFKALAVGFFVLGAFLMLVRTEGTSELISRGAGLTSLLGYGFCAWMSGRRTNRRHGVYAINHDGFSLIGSDGKSALFVDWKEVQGISATDLGYGHALTFAFRDPDRIKGRMSSDQRARALENEAVGLPTLTIPQTALDTPVDEIRTVSQRFFFGQT